MLKVPPLTTPLLVTVVCPDFTHEIVIGLTEPVYVPLHVDLLLLPSSVQPVRVIVAAAVSVTDELDALAACQFVPSRVVTRYVYEPSATPVSLQDEPLMGAANVPAQLPPAAPKEPAPSLRSTK